MSTLQATNLKHGSSASNNLVLDANGNVTAAGTVAMASPFAMRNKIINGAMEIDQRNAGASVTPANGAYTLDRWYATLTQASKYSVQRNAGSVTPPTWFINYLGVTSLSSYSVAAGDLFSVAQQIEGLNATDLAWGSANAKTVTLSFWVRSSLTGTHAGNVQNYAQTQSYVFTYTISSANTWEYKTITIQGPTAGVWATDNTSFAYVRFNLGIGSTYQTATTNAWASGNFWSTSGATSVVGTNGATFYLTGVQLEVGSVATPFERRLYTTELQLAQRYCQIYNVSIGEQYNGDGSSVGKSTFVSFKTTMRVAPTISLSNQFTSNVSSSSTSYISEDGFSFRVQVTATGNFYRVDKATMTAEL